MKQRILLAHLVLSEGRPVPTSRLITDLWSEGEPRRPAHALQEHVSRLRLSTGLDISLLEGAGYRLPLASVETDTKSFLRLASLGQEHLELGEYETAIEVLEEALGLWRGPLMEDLENVDGLRAYILHLEQAWREAASARVDAYLENGRAETIIGELRRSLDRDPMQEQSWYQLMLALHQTGRRNEAMVSFHEARETFLDTLGMGPSPRLQELYKTVLHDDVEDEDVKVGHDGSGLARTRSSAQRRLQPASAASRLVGRHRETDTLERAWRRSAEGIQMVTISGEPGAGKSFLAAEFVRRISPGVVLTGKNQQVSREPYHPFAQVLRNAENAVPGESLGLHKFRYVSSLRRILPELEAVDDDAADTHGGGSRAVKTMEAMAAWLEDLCSRTPVALVIEDVHWADPQSVRLLHHLLHSPRNIRLLIITTLRDVELQRADDDLNGVAQLLRQSDNVTHLPLPRLTADEIDKLVERESEGRGELSSSTRTYVQRACGGNPLFAIELTRHLLLTQPSGELKSHTLVGLRQVIEGYVDALPQGAGDLLRDAAILIPPFSPSTLVEVARMSERDVDEMLGVAERAGILEEVSGVRYVFSHDVVRDVLYDSLPITKRTSLHTRAASELKKSGPAAVHDYHGAIAHHLRNSDAETAQAEAAAHLGYAGEEALQAGAPETAEELFHEALEIHEIAGDPRLRCDLLISLGLAQLRNAREVYRMTLLDATRLAMDLGDSQRLTRAVLCNSRGWWSSSVEIDHERVAGLEAALAACHPADQGVRAQLLVMWAQENVHDRSLREDVLGASAEALELAESGQDPEVLTSVLASRYAVLYALFERPSECVVLSQRLLSWAQQHGLSLMTLAGAIGLAQSSMRYGDFQTADRYLQQAEQLAETLNHPPRLWLVRGWRAMREAMSGRLDVAEGLAEETYALGVRSGQSDAFTWFSGQIFTFRLLQGRLAELLPTLRTHAAETAGVVPAWRAALALTLARSGHRDEGEKVLEELAAENFSQLPQDILWLNALCYLAMACETLGRGDLGNDLYELLVPYSGMIATNGTIDAGPVDLQLGALAHLIGNAEAAEAHLTSAVNQCRRVEAPIWQAQAEARLAETRALSAGCEPV